MVISILGGLIVTLAVLDLFFTVLDGDGFSVLSSRVYRVLWWVWRHGARGLPPSTRRVWLSVGAPLMIPTIVAVWFALIITGFALIYFGGMSPQNFFFGGGSQPSLAAAFRLSWVTLSTIGFVEISPSSTTYSFTVAAEAILGGVVLTMAITYFLRVHQILLQFHCLATTLHHHAGDISRPQTYLSTHFHEGQPQAIEPWLHDTVTDLVHLHEGLRRHPIVYYYHPRRRWRSLPHLVETLGQIAAGLRWGVPDNAPLKAHPSLQALVSALPAMIDDLEHRFVPVVHRSRPIPLDPTSFADVMRGRLGPSDPWAERFLEMDREVRELAGGMPAGTHEETYHRYREWLPFAARISDFVDATTWDLGYGKDLRPDSDDVLDLVASWQDGPEQRPQALRTGGGGG